MRHAWLGLLALGLAGTGVAQEKFPVRPLELSVPLTPGATVDILARLYADKLAPRLGQPVTIANRVGAGGSIASAAMLKARPDGHSLLFGNSQHSINAGLLPDLPYDSVRDFSGVAMVAEAPSLVAVSARMGIKTLKEFLALARSKPGSINYGGGTAGSATHMAGADFSNAAGVQLTYIPYKGGSLIPDLIENRVQAMFAPVAFLQSHIKEGKLIALAITSAEPIKHPIVAPSAQEAMPGYTYTTWYGMLASSKTPPGVLKRLGSEMQAISDEADIRAKLLDQGILPRKMALAEFDKFLRADIQRVTALIKAAGIKAE